MQPAREFLNDSVDPKVRGFLHTPAAPSGDALVLSHGAGADCNSPLLTAISDKFAEHGFLVLRCDLPFRQQKRSGPPFGYAEKDRAGLRNAVAVLRQHASGRIFLGGHSYGGRQSSMLCAEDPDLVAGLLLLSYPLHPPRKPEQMRTQHFPKLRTPGLFVHGTRDPFGSVDEMAVALPLIPAKTRLLKIDGAGHDLGFKGKAQAQNLPEIVVAEFKKFFP